MATSGSTNFSVNRDQILTEALELIGVLEAGETAGAADITTGAMSLNLMCKSLQTDRIFLRFVDEQTLSLVDGTASYDLATGTLRVLDAWLRINSQDTLLNFIARESYDAEVTKSAEDQPTDIYIDYAPTVPKAYFLPVPGAAYTMHYRRERSVEDFDASTDDADFPVKAQDMLVMGMCHRYACKFQLPIDERMYWEGQYEKAKNAYRAGDTQRHSRQIVAPHNVV